MHQFPLETDFKMTKKHVFYDYMCMKCPARENPQRQKADCWLWGLRNEKWGMIANGCGGVLFEMMKIS